MQTFPKPLTPQEEKECLERIRAGDREARDLLIRRNLRLVAHVVKKYHELEQEKEDLISIGTIGLIKAVDTFNASKGSRLATYAAKCIDNEILMMIRAEKKRGRDVSLYEPVGTDKEGNEISLLEVLTGEEKDIAREIGRREEQLRACRAVQEVLEGKEKTVIALRYGLWDGKEHTQREIAGKMGISRSYVSRIEKSGLRKLREVLE